jgi:glycosyltransferase involved in cell wall biosynthesis
MSKGRKKKKSKTRERKAKPVLPRTAGLRSEYDRACGLAMAGRHAQAREVYHFLEQAVTAPPLRALVANDLAALAVLGGDPDAGRRGFQDALDVYPHCEPARANLALLEARDSDALSVGRQGDPERPQAAVAAGPIRVAVLSLLFNWPSTGGGNVHTIELCRFLARAGYEVLHVFARYVPWEVGRCDGPLPYPSRVLDFDAAAWNAAGIQARFREAVDAFVPDHVLVTDSWNMKPLLAEAVEHYPYILRFQAMECLCPLNNVRLLLDGPGQFRQCERQQLASPDVCVRCVGERGHRSGALHQAERELSGFGREGYYERLRKVLRGAEAVLVVNPLQEAMLRPYTARVRVVTSGFDPDRFPWPPADGGAAAAPRAVRSLLFAGLVDEPMKGFPVVHEACARLWRRRQDFELVATADPPGRVDAFTRFIGWQSQEDLPRHVRAADVLVIPTIAQEALGRTAVEAMGAGRPVVASRLGGLPFTVADGSTGLLCEPGDPEDLARKIDTLLDDPDLCRRLGQAGRRRFEEDYAWDAVIERHYRPLLAKRRAVVAG